MSINLITYSCSGVHEPVLRVPVYLRDGAEDVRVRALRLHGLSIQQVTCQKPGSILVSSTVEHGTTRKKNFFKAQAEGHCADQSYIFSWPMVISNSVNEFFVAV
jgi:hypothetical protein